MKTKIRRKLARCKRQIERRLDKNNLQGLERPMFTAANIHYEISDRDRGIAHGGIGAFHMLARRFGLIDAIDRRLVLLKVHLPYHESDHVLNLAYNALCEGTCLEDIELRRNDEAFLDALGARRIPDPTTAGDFCRRFRDAADIRCLQDAFHETRKKVWAEQPDAFFDQAIIDMDGALVGTTGACKDGMDIAYDGTWGYHPLILSLANTGEVLSIVNRPGNRPSHEGAASEADRCLRVCFAGGFRRVLLRGDTDFSQTEHLDRWHADPRVRFIFGYDNCPNLVDMAEKGPESAWRKLERPPRYAVATQPRQRPDNVKEAIVKRRQFETLRLQSEEVAEFNYQPTKCGQVYRMVVVRKNITKEKGELRLQDEIRYLFYITNDWVSETDEIVFCANDRCDQENLLAQLLGGCRALRAPVDNLYSNWAYMVMTALAWDLKAWWALLLPEGRGRHRETYRADKRWVLGIEFRTFVQTFVRLPCQVVRTGRRLLYRLLSWNPHQAIFWRVIDVLKC
ncbi:MAG TPA: IS1380 family transposase [Candidatus Acidoferrales bacterium]|nr:IS1380 family transposase [Candidatus Acidoferrales bacterium]